MAKSDKKTKKENTEEEVKESGLDTEESFEVNEEEQAFIDDYGNILALWEFPEFIKHERGKLWYLSFTVVFVALLVYSYYTDNILFAIILVMFAFLYLRLGKGDPQTMETAITEDGIFIGSKFMPYEEFANFYIIYYPPEVKNLYLQPKSILKNRIALPLENQNPIHIREILLQYLEEDLEKEEAPASEGISKILKL